MCPIIVSAKHFKDSNLQEGESSTVTLPALWSLIPSWHSGDKPHGLTTNNARLENLSTSKVYKPLLDRGKRCVIPVEGFYEWQTAIETTKASNRAVYFIYMNQDEGVKIETRSTWDCCNVRLMFIAGLFDVFYDKKGDSIFSFTVLTFESDKHFKWLHHRTPAILESTEQVNKWLDYERYPKEVALQVLKHPNEITWHQVSNKVNSSRNKSENCKKPLEGNKLNFV